jgi:periplasmic protein TonB
VVEPAPPARESHATPQGYDAIITKNAPTKATESPVVSETADTRYFTTVYRMIRSHLRAPSDGVAASSQGVIVFTVDERGKLLLRKQVSASGSPSLDMAVMAAIAEAAPYPTPPNGQPRSMRLTYGK